MVVTWFCLAIEFLRSVNFSVWRAVSMGTYFNPGNKGFQEEVRIEFEKILEGTGVSRKWIEM